MSDVFPTFPATPADKQAMLEAQFETEGKGAVVPAGKKERKKRGPNKPKAVGEAPKRAKRQPRVTQLTITPQAGSPAATLAAPNFAKLGRIARSLTEEEASILVQMLWDDA